ncbi:hypothetical protein CHFL109739_08315 [Chryseobacterium flavum]
MMEKTISLKVVFLLIINVNRQDIPTIKKNVYAPKDNADI